MQEDYFQIRSALMKPVNKPTFEDGTQRMLSAILKDVEQQIDEQATKLAEEQISEFTRAVMAKKRDTVAAIMESIHIAVNNDPMDGRTLGIQINYRG